MPCSFRDLFSFCSLGSCGSEIRHGRCEDQDVGPGRTDRTSAFISSPVSTLTVRTPVGSGRERRTRHQSHLGTSPPGSAGQGETHPTRGAVPQEPDRIQRLPGGARRDHDLPPFPGRLPSQSPAHVLNDLIRLQHPTRPVPLSIGEGALAGSGDLVAQARPGGVGGWPGSGDGCTSARSWPGREPPGPGSPEEWWPEGRRPAPGPPGPGNRPWPVRRPRRRPPFPAGCGPPVPIPRRGR